MVDPGWVDMRQEDPFHPLYVPVDRQGSGRFDNPHGYVALYAATTAAAAVGETLGNYAVWTAEELARSKERRPRCLVSFELDDQAVVVDLDDASSLVRLGLRPSDVIRRNRDRTQEVALQLWLRRGAEPLDGLRWRSYWRPEWEVVTLWSPGLDPPWFPLAEVKAVEELTIESPAVTQAADVLPRLPDLRR